MSESKEEADQASKYPLNVYRCNDCHHFQLGVAVDPKKLYATNYTYLSAVGKSFVQHLEQYSAWIQKKCNLQSNALVIDVGSNDGTCLKEFKKIGCRVCGVDPASLPAKIANEDGIPTLNSFFDDHAVSEIIKKYGKADFITSHNVLAHVDDLKSVFKNIYSLLKLNGYFCFEIGYFKEVLNNKFFDTIYHEHLDYHHARPLSKFLTRLGFDLVDLSVNSVQGGSLRLLLKKTGNGKVSSSAQKFLDKEHSSILYQNEQLAIWQTEIITNMKEFGESVRSYVLQGKKVVGYGVPTKATLLTYLAKLNSEHISFMVEDNPLKTDKFMPGSSIPIFKVNKIVDVKPDVIVIFAWNFSDDIIKNLKDFVNWPTVLIVPLPNLVEEKIQ